MTKDKKETSKAGDGPVAKLYETLITLKCTLDTPQGQPSTDCNHCYNIFSDTRRYLKFCVSPTTTKRKVLKIILWEFKDKICLHIFFYCCTVHFDNIKVLLTNKCTLLLNT